MERYLSYYKRGLSLANKNLYLFLFAVLLSVPNGLSNVFKLFGIPFSWISNISWLAFPLILAGYFTALRVLNDRLEEKQITASIFWKIFFQMLRRSIVPSVLIFASIMLLLFVVVLILGLLTLFNPISFLLMGSGFMLIFAPFAYFGIIYAIEGASFSSSIKQSLVFAKRHLAFTYSSVLLPLVIFVVQYPLRGNIAIQLLFLIISAYSSLVIGTSLLIYYQENKPASLQAGRLDLAGAINS